MSAHRCQVIGLVFVLVSALLLNPAAAAARSPEQEINQTSAGNTFIDALFYRPVGLIIIPVGAVLFVVTLPFSALGRNVGDAFDNLVASPARYTFVRPLGDI